MASSIRIFTVVFVIVGVGGCSDESMGSGGITARPLYVNMKGNDSHYVIGRYEDGRPDPSGAVLDSSAPLWSPSPVKTKTGIRVFAARGTADGWTQVVSADSRDGQSFGPLRVVHELHGDQLRTPTVVRHRGSFHLWYSADSGGFASEVTHATSEDGRRFNVDGPKFRAGPLNAVSPSYVFRRDRRWWMFVSGYTRDLSEARAHLLTFRHPGQRRYRYAGRLRTRQPTPKIDLSLICRQGDRLRALFTLFGARGDRYGWEWLSEYRAGRLRGAWRPTGSAREPALPHENDGSKISVENAEAPRASARLQRC